MKRVSALLLLLTLTLSVYACAVPKDSNTEIIPGNSSPDEPIKPAGAFSGDFDNRFGRGYESIIETDEAYYYCSFSGKYLYYYDKQSGISGVLCPKPECTHDEADKQNNSCGGFVHSHAKTLFLSEGRIGFVASARTPDYIGPALFRMNPDGTGRELVKALDFGETQNLSWPQRFDLHRRKLYGYNNYEKVEEGEPILYFSIVSLDPATGEYRTIYEKTDCGITIFPKLFYNGDYLYFTVPDAGPRMNTETLEIYRWDIGKEELEKLFSSGEEGMPGSFFDLWVENGCIYTSPGIPEAQNPAVYLISDGELQKVFGFDEDGAVYLIDGGAVCVTYPGFDLIAADMDGNTLRRIDRDLSFLEDVDYVVDPSRCSVGGIYGDTSELFVVYKGLKFEHGDGSKTSGSCLVRYDLTEEAPTAQLLAVSPWD